MFVWLAVLIALAPAFALFVYVARTRKSMWLAFAFGAAGWTAALYARMPILSGISSIIGSSILIFASASLLAGLFEEGVKYGLMRKIRYLRIDWKHVLSLGLGWGFMEAVLIYAVNMLAAVYILGYEIPFSDMLVGAVERDFVVIFHVAMTFVIYKAVTSRKLTWVAFAVALHAAVDFISVTLYYVLRLPAWHVEAAILVMAILTVMFAYMLLKTKDLTTKSTPEIPKIPSNVSGRGKFIRVF